MLLGTLDLIVLKKDNVTKAFLCLFEKPIRCGIYTISFLYLQPWLLNFIKDLSIYFFFFTANLQSQVNTDKIGHISTSW